MAQIPDHIKKTLDDYVHALAKEIHVKSAFLFGSYARNLA
jgi:predicted nucleotidyltransferase